LFSSPNDNQRFVPSLLEIDRNEPVLRLHGIVLASAALGLESRLLERELTLATSGIDLLFASMQCIERCFDPQGLNHPEQLVLHRTVNH
jgi:hypothetical protein